MERELASASLDAVIFRRPISPLAPLFKGIKVVACSDINMNAAELREEEFGVKAQTVDELLANPEVDVVVNLTFLTPLSGVQTHSGSGQACLFRKAAVLSLEQGEDLRRIARKKACPLVARPIRFWVALTSWLANILMKVVLAASHPHPAM